MYLEPINLLQCLDAFMVLFGLLLIGPIPRFNALALLLGLQLLQMMFNFLEETGSVHFLVTPIFTLGFGPAVYVFCYQLVNVRLLSKSWIHFLPMFMSLPLTQWAQLVIALGSLSQLIYLTTAMLLIRRYHRVTVQARADASSLSLGWMNLTLIFLLIMMVQDLIRLNLQPFTPLAIRHVWYFINSFLYFLLTAYLIIVCVRQPLLFSEFRELSYLEFVDTPASKPTLQEKDVNSAVFSQVDALIREQELFKQARFSLRDLAAVSGLNEKLLSGLINQHSGRNFCDYINKLRIDAICRELRQAPYDISLLQIAMDMGFNAKSTFNTAFKKETGLTPTQFVQQNPVSRSES